MRRILRCVLLAVAAVGAADPAPSAADGAIDDLRGRARDAIRQRDWADARTALERFLEARPNDAEALYDLAVSLAQLGETEASAQRLIDAITHGYADLHTMAQDGRLAPVRGEPRYRAVISGWRELLDARADRNEQALRDLLGGGYQYDRDERRRLLFASAFRESSFELAREEIEQVARWAFATLFETPEPDDPRPDPWVTVILPNPEHFAMFMIRLGAGPNVGGLYDQNRMQLICQDIGPSLRHEFFHVLHWRSMTRLGQRHPDWIMEGLGTLVEDMDPFADGASSEPVPSWRTNIAKRLNRLGRRLSLDELMTMERRRFRSHRPNANYAQARAFMLYLHHQGKLDTWYHTYTATYDDDPTGRLAVERVFDATLEEVDQAYGAWLRELPEAPERIEPGMASLGVTVTAGRGDGPVIDELASGTPAGRAGLRMRDVILSIDGRATRTLPDLVRVLSSYEPGDAVEVEVRRGSRRRTFTVELTERQR